MAAQPGPCLSKITRYYYDKEEGKCREFIYGGCQGNKNRFLTLEHCQNECEPLITTTVAPSNNETIVTESKFVMNLVTNFVMRFKFFS